MLTGSIIKNISQYNDRFGITKRWVLDRQSSEGERLLPTQLTNKFYTLV